MTWAEQGFNPSPLTPAETLIHHLRRALYERIWYCGTSDIIPWWKGDIEPLNPLTPTCDAINGILALLRPSGSTAYSERTWLDYTFWPEGSTVSGMDVMPKLFQLFTTDTPEDGKGWCAATLDDYYARMNTLAGFDIRKDITPLTPLTSALFNGIRNVIDSFRFCFSYADYTSHYRAWSSSYNSDTGQWEDSFEEWMPYREGFEYMGGLWLGQWMSSGTDYITGNNSWMLDGDGIRWIHNDDRHVHGIDCLAFVTHCTSNSSAPEPLDEYVQGEHYVIPWDGSPMNLTEGYNPPAPPHHAVPTEQDNSLVFRYGCAVVDFSKKLLYYDPPE